jgi:hypothetical protein
MRARRLAAIALVAWILAGCGHMPVTSMVKLARVDFAATEPAALRAAVKLPRAIRPRPQGVTLRIGVRLASGHEEAQHFLLREASDAGEMAALKDEIDADTHVFAFRLEPAEAQRLAAFRDGLKRKQAERGGSGGALTIAIRPDACRTGALPAGPVRATTYLRTAEMDGYVPLARDVDLRTVMTGRDVAAEIPGCG